MSGGQRLRVLGATVVFTGLTLTVMLVNSPRGRAHDRDDDDPRIEQGFDIAPVPLDLDRRDRKLVGLGSYLVNAVADCNGCHSAGPKTEFASGGNPYFLSPPFSGKEETNTATYLGGGRDFGPVGSVPHLYSRNLTPDKTEMPAGGRTYEQFVDIMREGTDFDHIHPNCTGPGTPANCFAPPFNGDLLQVMRWPNFRNMTNHELRAMYEYLGAIPCNPGQVIEGAPYLQNVCE
jgi:hypothetical protein